MEVAGLAVWGGAQRRAKLTDEQVPLSISALASALPPDQGTIGPESIEAVIEFLVSTGTDRCD